MALLTYVSDHIRERGLEVWDEDRVVELLGTVRAGFKAV
jgi:hypothetical protein